MLRLNGGARAAFNAEGIAMKITKRAEANRKNALVSTGPRTPEGKHVVAQNAIQHGILAILPVLPSENVADWQMHRVGVLESLAPVGGLELALAERVALCLWRLRRVAVYEAAVTAAGMDEANEEAAGFDQERLEKIQREVRDTKGGLDLWRGGLELLKKLPTLPDDASVNTDDAYMVLRAVSEQPDKRFDIERKDFLIALGIPPDETDDPFGWKGWTAGMVRRGLAEMFTFFGSGQETILAQALENLKRDKQESILRGCKVFALEYEAKILRRGIRRREKQLTGKRMLPSERTCNKISRYEVHLSRQMSQALHELQRLQAARNGPMPPPAALDIQVNGNGNPLRTIRQGRR